MAHSTRVSVVHPDGEITYTTISQADKLLTAGYAVRIRPRRIALAGAVNKEWIARRSGYPGPTVMQHVPVRDRHDR
jgi:hypothetical protein